VGKVPFGGCFHGPRPPLAQAKFLVDITPGRFSVPFGSALADFFFLHLPGSKVDTYPPFSPHNFFFLGFGEHVPQI